MQNRIQIILSIVLIVGIELSIYLWAVLTASLEATNFFAIEPEFIFDKCARNSGRVSSALNLIILGMIGVLGLKHIYAIDTLKNRFRMLITLFAINHLVHFFYVFQNFKHHTMALNISDNLHGFITIICIVLMPFILWTFNKLNNLLSLLIILHLFNVSYFIMETFYNKIKPEKPAYHNQFGILITACACVYVLYRVYRDYQSSRNAIKQSS